MNINGVNIKFSKEDKALLRKFFDDNHQFINNNSFIEYENIKAFGNLYENFIEENNLRENDILMLFLVEIRYNQLAYKITDNSVKLRAKRLAVPKNRLNDTISKWYWESKTEYYASSSGNNENLVGKLKQNGLERQKSFAEAAKIIVK